MSFEAMVWAFGQATPSSSSKFVLVALANAAHVGDWKAWPSVAYLAGMTQQDRKTVLSNLALLERSGLIKRESGGSSSGKATRWTLSVEPSKVSTSPKNGIGTAPKSGTGTSAENGTGASGNQSQKRDRGIPKTVLPPVPKTGHRTSKRNQELTRAGAAHASAAGQDSARGTRLPDDWTLPPEWRAWAIEKRPDLNPDVVAETFADHWRAQPGAKGRKADWLATWRNWVRNERATPGTATAAPVRQANPDTDYDFADEVKA